MVFNVVIYWDINEAHAIREISINCEDKGYTDLDKVLEEIKSSVSKTVGFGKELKPKEEVLVKIKCLDYKTKNLLN